jgi:hypothetical protein
MNAAVLPVRMAAPVMTGSMGTPALVVMVTMDITVKNIGFLVIYEQIFRLLKLHEMLEPSLPLWLALVFLCKTWATIMPGYPVMAKLSNDYLVIIGRSQATL